MHTSKIRKIADQLILQYTGKIAKKCQRFDVLTGPFKGHMRLLMLVMHTSGGPPLNCSVSKFLLSNSSDI